MAKYSVNGVEVIKDDGNINWARIANAAALALNATKRTVGSGEFYTYSLENDGAGKVRLVETRYDCDNWDSNCVCDCNCSTGD